MCVGVGPVGLVGLLGLVGLVGIVGLVGLVGLLGLVGIVRLFGLVRLLARMNLSTPSQFVSGAFKIFGVVGKDLSSSCWSTCSMNQSPCSSASIWRVES